MNSNNGAKQACHLLLTIVLGILLTACGGGGGGNNNNPPAALVSQGVLVDAVVEGIRFETATQTGLTDASGIRQVRS